MSRTRRNHSRKTRNTRRPVTTPQIATLSPEDVQGLVLDFIREQGIVDMATLVGLPVESVKSLLSSGDFEDRCMRLGERRLATETGLTEEEVDAQLTDDYDALEIDPRLLPVLGLGAVKYARL